MAQLMGDMLSLSRVTRGELGKERSIARRHFTFRFPLIFKEHDHEDEEICNCNR